MKKILISLCLLCLPLLVHAETCSGIGTDTYCNASSSNCLSSLQANYNTWNVSEKHSGTSCVKVIAKYTCSGGKYQSKTYLSGYNPTKNFLCSDGNVASSSSMTLRGTGAVEADVVGDSCTSTMYVPEAWEIVCASTGSTNTANSSSSGNNSSSSSSGNGTGNLNNSSNSGNSSGTNSNGQITGTTDVSNTGVETYFIVLICMVVLAYIVLLVSKKNNIFKSI